MKKLYLVLLVALMISGLFVGQASAAAPSSNVAAAKCGKTYTVVGGDTLTSIADHCGTTVTSILDLNPSITDGNMIYSGQVIRLTASAAITTTTTTAVDTTSSSSATTYVNASVSLSDYRTYVGHSIVVKVDKFPANAAIRIYLYNTATSIGTYSDATTNSNGGARQTITIPTYASQGQTWEVKVITTNQMYLTSAISSPITIIGSSDDDDNINGRYPNAEVTLSSTSVSAGGTVTAYARNFPENQSIEYCVRKKSSSSCGQIYSGTTNSIGYAQMTVTIPSNARSGEIWIVFVKTVNSSKTVSDQSPRISIK